MSVSTVRNRNRCGSNTQFVSARLSETTTDVDGVRNKARLSRNFFPRVSRSSRGAPAALLLVILPILIYIYKYWESRVPQQRVLMFTYVFGEKQAKKRLFRLFVESARLSGVDIAIVGDPRPEFPLPPNVRHVSVSWDEFTDRVSARLFNGTEPGDLRESQRAQDNPYQKITDFKPLFGYLFPEVTEGYAWWGHLDNDIVLGNLRSFLSHSTLSSSDVITTQVRLAATRRDGASALGPFTLYRNTPTMNELFRLADRPLEELFGHQHPLNFDEWGEQWGPVHPNGTYSSFESSMSGILTRHRERLGIRYNGRFPLVGDGSCKKNFLGEAMCLPCRLDQLPNGRQKLMSTWFGFGVWEVALYHFLYSKGALETQLASDTVMDELLGERQFQYRYNEGFIRRWNGTRFHQP